VWDVQRGKVVLTLTGHEGGVTGIQLNGSVAASSSYDGSVRLWNVRKGICIAIFKEPQNFVRCVGFIGDLQLI
jgi:WD40 repeat protein